MSGYGNDGAQPPDNPCERCGQPMAPDAIGYCCSDDNQEVCLASAASDGAPCGQPVCKLCAFRDLDSKVKEWRHLQKTNPAKAVVFYEEHKDDKYFNAFVLSHTAYMKGYTNIIDQYRKANDN